MSFQQSKSKTQQIWVHELTAQVMAAELQLTYFAARHGKDSVEYQQALKDFATAWYLLKKNRNQEDFLHEVTQPVS